MSNAMTVVETSTLMPPALDWATAKACDKQVVVELGGTYGVPNSRWYVSQVLPSVYGAVWSPTTDPMQAWELVETHIKRLGDANPGVAAVSFDAEPTPLQYFATTHDNGHAIGPTKRIAVCRAVVLAKLGAVVEVPSVLVSA